MAQQRIDFFGQFRPTGVDPTAGAKARALAGLANTTGNIATNLGVQARRREIGQETLEAGREGQQVQTDAQGNRIAPEMRDELTPQGRAFNEAATLAYRADVRRESKVELNRLANKHANDPEAFKQQSEAYLNGITQGLPEEMRFVISNDIQDRIADSYTKLNNNYFESEQRANVATVAASLGDIEDDALTAAREGDGQALTKYLAERTAIQQRGIESGLLDPVAVEKQNEMIREQVQVQSAMGDIQRIFKSEGSLQDKTVAASDYIKNLDTGDLNPDQMDALVDNLQATMADEIKQQSQLTAQEQKEISYRTVELQLDAKFGRAPMADILSDANEMFANNQISEAEYKGIKSDVMTYAQKSGEQADLDMKVLNRVRGDKSQIVSQADVDGFYERNIAPDIESLPPERAMETKVNYAIKTGVVPKQVTNEIKNGLLSNDTTLINNAAMMLEQLDDAANIQVNLTPNERAFADIVNNLTDTMEPSEAIDYARQLTDPTNKARIEFRTQQIKEEEFEDNYQDDIESEFSSLFTGNEINDVNLGPMTNEYKQTFEALFKAGMDEDSAKSKAMTLLKKNWQYSEAFGTVMKHAPDAFYQDALGQSDYIKPQLKEWYNSMQFKGDVPVNLMGEVNDMFLLSDDKTERMGNNPDYLVMTVGESGELMPLMMNNPDTGKLSAVRWSPDVQAQNDKIKPDAKEAFDKALSKGKDKARMSVEAVERLDALSI